MRHLRDQHKFYKVVRYGTFWPKTPASSTSVLCWVLDQTTVVKADCDLGPQANFKLHSWPALPACWVRRGSGGESGLWAGPTNQFCENPEGENRWRGTDMFQTVDVFITEFSSTSAIISKYMYKFLGKLIVEHMRV